MKITLRPSISSIEEEKNALALKRTDKYGPLKPLVDGK